MLAIVTCHYNFAEYIRPRQNLWRFLRQMKRDGIPVYGVEIYKEDSNPITTGVENWIQIKANCNQIMWQKERALNIAEKMVPSIYNNIAWVDADVWFDRVDWIKATEESLEKYDVVQMFDMSHLTNRDGTIFTSRPSVGYTRSLNSKWVSHPGLAWAMRRSVWERGEGLFQYSISGGADSLIALVLTKEEIWDHVWSLLGSNRKPFYDWIEKYSSISLGYVPMNCFHEWHGDFKNRGYSERAKLLPELDIQKHIKIGDNNLLEFTDDANPKLILDLYQYYFYRREDG